MRPRRTRLIPLLLPAALLPFGCGSDSGSDPNGRAALEDVIAQVEDLDGEQREKKLLRLAQKEGAKLSWYTSLTNDTESAVAEAFEDEYDIEVSVYRSTSETVAQRISEEARASFEGTDVVETNGTEMAQLDREDVFVPYRPSGFSRLVEGSAERWTVTRLNKFVVAWNTDLVKPGTEPGSVEELADPRWEGKVAIEEGDADWYSALRDHWVEQGRSEAEADELLEGIVRNSRVLPSHALMAQLLGANEITVAASNYEHQTLDLIDDGAPVAYKPTAEPVLTRPQGVALLETASHPAAALLFVEWLTSAGQDVLAEHNVLPAREDLSTAPGAEEVLIDVEAFVKRAEELEDEYGQLLRLGERVGDGG